MGWRLAQSTSRRPRLLAIPAFGRIAGLCNRHPNSNREYANAFGVRLKAFTDLARNECLVGPGLIVGGINFGWLVGWLSGFWAQTSSVANLEVCDFYQALRWSCHAWGRGMRAAPRLFIIDPGICLTTEGKSRKNLSHGIQKELGWPAKNAIHLVDLAITGNGLDWPLPPLAFA